VDGFQTILILAVLVLSGGTGLAIGALLGAAVSRRGNPA
jgi:hypothetical protein